MSPRTFHKTLRGSEKKSLYKTYLKPLKEPKTHHIPVTSSRIGFWWIRRGSETLQKICCYRKILLESIKEWSDHMTDQTFYPFIDMFNAAERP